MIPRMCLAGLILAVGCASPTVVRFNGQVLEFENMSAAQFPEGVKITRMGGDTMEVSSDEAIVINGKEVWVEDETVSIGGHQVEVAEGDRVMVGKRGSVQVRADKGPPQGWQGLVRRTLTRKPQDEQAAPDVESSDQGENPLAAGSANSKRSVTSRRRSSVAAGSQADESWWSFLR